MSHSFEDLYSLYSNQPDGPDAEIQYFRENGIRAIRLLAQGERATIIMEDAQGRTHEASGQIPQPDERVQAAQEDLGYEGAVSSDPLTIEERSVIDPAGVPSFFIAGDAFHGGQVPPQDLLTELGIDNNGEWFKQYQETLKFRYNPPSERINDPTPPEDLRRLLETSKTKFKYRFIKENVIRLRNIEFPFTVKTRAANINPRNTNEPPVQVDFTLKDAIYFSALHPHVIAGFRFTGGSNRFPKYKFLFLENTSTDDEPGTALAREIMRGRGMFVQTATTSPRKPVTPTTAQTTPTKVEKDEIKKTSDAIASQKRDEARAEAERQAGTTRNALAQLDQAKPLGREILFRGDLQANPRVWVSQLPTATSEEDVTEVGNIVASHLNRITQEAGDDGLIDEERQNTWANIDEYTGDFYDTTVDPERNKLDYEIKRTGRYVFIQKLLKTQSPTVAEEEQKADETALAAANRSAEPFNLDDWTTNAPPQRGSIVTYLNPRYPVSFARNIPGEGSYFVVMRAPQGVDTQEQYLAQADSLRNTMYQELCKNYAKPVTDMPPEIEYEQKPYFYERPNAAPLVLLIISQDQFDTIAAFGNIKSSLDELTLQRAILASQKRAELNIAFTMGDAANLFLEASRVVYKYNQIIRKQGLRASDIGVNLIGVRIRLKRFPEKLRQALTYNGVFPEDSDQIEIGFTKELEPLHIIHKSTIHFGGFGRVALPNELGKLDVLSGQADLTDEQVSNLTAEEVDLENLQFPPELLTGENFFRGYSATHFGYVFSAMDIIRPEYANQETPWVDFVRDFTYPPPVIRPTQVNNKPKLSDDEDDDLPTMDLTADASEIESDDILSDTDVAFQDKAKTPDTKQRVTTASQEAATAVHHRSFMEKKKRLERKAKNFEPLVEDAIMNCGNLPNLLDQIKELNDLFDLVLDGISLDELFAALRDSLLQDLQKLFAMKDLAEGFTPDIISGASGGRPGDQGGGLAEDVLTARAAKLVCSPSSEFNDFLQNDLACALDQIGDSLKNRMLGNNLNNIPLDQLISDQDKLRNLFGISIPFIPIEGLLSFILKLVIEILKEVLRDILVALVQEALEKYLDCENIPLLSDDLAKLGDIKNPAQLLEYGRSQLADLTAGIDMGKLLDKLNIDLPLDQLQEALNKVSNALNSMEMLALLSGNAGPLIMAIVRDQFGGALTDDMVDMLFEKIGNNIPNEIKNDIVPEEYYVDYCNRGDFVRAAVKGLQLLRDKGLSNEDIKNQADDEIRRAADKIKSMCDFEDLANNALINALGNIPAPDAVTSMQNKSSAAMDAGTQAMIQSEAKSFILGRTPPSYAGFNILGFGYGTNQIIRNQTTDEEGDRNLTLKGSGGLDAEKVAVSYESNGDQFKIGDLKITVSVPTEPTEGQKLASTELNEVQEVPNNIVTIIVHRTGLNTNNLLDGEGQFRENLKEQLESDRNVLVFLQTQPDRVYDKTTTIVDRGRPQAITRQQVSPIIEEFLIAHQSDIYGFGITSNQIVQAHIAGSTEDGQAAFIRPPQRHEEGKYPYPFMQNLVIDRGNNMEIFNAYFRKGDINTKKNQRQDYFESGLFDAGKTYTKLYAGLEEPPSLVRAGPQYEKRVKRTAATKGICTRLMPFLISIWPILATNRNNRIKFCTKDETISTDRVFREVIENYLTRKVTFRLEDDGMLDLYQKTLAEDDFEIADIVQAFLDGLFVDSPDTNNYDQYADFDIDRYFSRLSNSGPEGSARYQRVLTNRRRFGLRGNQPALITTSQIRNAMTRNLYPVEVLLAVSTIYLDASCNTTDLLGISFKMATFTADELLKKLYNPII